MMETAASYTEAKIKTYGFEIKLGQCMHVLTFDPAAFRRGENDPIDVNGHAIPFEMLFMLPNDDHRCRLSVIVSPHHRNHFGKWLSDIDPVADIETQFLEPVELLYFFGPHFGDRFGIADFTFRALAENDLPVIASTFSSASIFLVLPEHGAHKAKSIFTERFEIPTALQRPVFFRRKARRENDAPSMNASHEY